VYVYVYVYPCDITCLVSGQTTMLNYEISTTWKMKPRTIPQKTSWLLMGTEQVTRPNLQARWWWWRRWRRQWWWWWWQWRWWWYSRVNV